MHELIYYFLSSVEVCSLWVLADVRLLYMLASNAIDYSFS